MNKSERIGQKFGKLTILEVYKGDNKHWFAKVVCECGKIKEAVFLSNLVFGKSKSCGCENTQRISNLKRTHSLSNSAEYGIWLSMKARCLNKKNKFYGNYGGRGITVCDSWLASFENFFRDMGVRPNKLYSLERVKNNEGYSKENCTWASRKEQSRNKRNNIWITIGSETKIIPDWCSIFGLNKKIVYKKAALTNDPTGTLISMIQNKDAKALRFKSKIILDFNTGIYYDSAKEASDLLGYVHSTLIARLNGRLVNKTSLQYV